MSAAPPRMRILHVDDVVDIVTSSCRLLELLGHTAASALSGAAALALLDEFDPDIMIIDIAMPDMSGYELAQELRHRNTRAFLVALTGFNAKADRERAYASGFDLHVAKPADLTKFNHILALGARHLEDRARKL